MAFGVIKTSAFSLALFSLLAAMPACAADQFDLICAGLQHRKPIEVRYRVDLSKKLFCVEDCKFVLAIAKVDEARITFQEADESSSLAIIHYVDRSNGRWVDYISEMEDASGTCQPAPFSGIPERKF